MIKIKQIIPQRFCLQCKGCCRFSRKDGPWIPKLLREEKNSPYLKDLDIVKSSSSEIKYSDFVCSYLKVGSNRCGVYKNRPFDCRLYPFLLNRKKSAIFLSVDTNCPYAKAECGKKRLKDYVIYLISLLKKHESLKMLMSNPGAIASYEGVTDIIRLDR